MSCMLNDDFISAVRDMNWSVIESFIDRDVQYFKYYVHNVNWMDSNLRPSSELMSHAINMSYEIGYYGHISVSLLSTMLVANLMYIGIRVRDNEWANDIMIIFYGNTFTRVLNCNSLSPAKYLETLDELFPYRAHLVSILGIYMNSPIYDHERLIKKCWDGE